MPSALSLRWRWLGFLVFCLCLSTKPSPVYPRSLPRAISGTSDFRVSEKAGGPAQTSPWIASLGAHGFVLVWWDQRQGRALWGQRLDLDGNPVGANIIARKFGVDANDTGRPFTVTADRRDGRFGISWAGSSGDGLTHLWVKFHDARGAARTDPMIVNTTSGDARWIDHDIAMNAAGQSIVIWSQMNAGTWRLFGQRFDALEQPLGHNFRIGSVADDVNQIEPRLAMRDKQIYVTWADDREAEYSRNYDIWATILNFGDPLSVAPGATVPDEMSLDQNYPNPFNPETRIRYTQRNQSRVKLEIFNLAGQLVARLVDAVQSAGAHVAAWDGRAGSGHRVSSGVYFYRLQAGESARQRKMLLLR